MTKQLISWDFAWFTLKFAGTHRYPMVEKGDKNEISCLRAKLNAGQARIRTSRPEVQCVIYEVRACPCALFRWEVGETNQNTVVCSPVERTSAAYFSPQSYISQKGTVLLLKSPAECRDKIMYESFTYVIISTCFLKEIFK